jgi:hypothetical protein
MSDQTPDDLTDLDIDPAIVERLRNGTASREDEIAKLEYWRRVATAYGDAQRVAELDALISSRRRRLES